MPVQYLTYQQVDKTKWDACIKNASNGTVYAYSFYLDTLAKHWDALVLNDYEAVMPLTWNKKYGLYYLYQPPFAASLGVFGNGLNAEMVNEFLQQVPAKFKYWDIYLNHGNLFSLKDFPLYQRMNYVLDLTRPYEDLFSRYRENIRRNIKRCGQLKASTAKDLPIDEVIALAKAQAAKFSPYTDEDFLNIKKIYIQLRQHEKAMTYGIVSPEKKLLASAAFFFSHGRAYYILVGNDPDGKTMGASHALIDAFIKDHAGKNILLDFEGSDIPGLAFFYSSFGATEEKYPGLKLNRLPWWAKLVKG